MKSSESRKPAKLILSWFLTADLEILTKRSHYRQKPAFNKWNIVASDHFRSFSLEEITIVFSFVFSGFGTTQLNFGHVESCVWRSNYARFINLATAPSIYSNILDLINILCINWQIDMKSPFRRKIWMFWFIVIEMLWSVKCCDENIQKYTRSEVFV